METYPLYFLVFSFIAIPFGLIIDFDPETISAFSTDFGKMVTAPPAGVFQPSSEADIAKLIRFSTGLPKPFTIGAWGKGHSVHGQALVPNGIVVNMSALRLAGDRITVYPEKLYVDAGGEQLWADVLNASLLHGLTPRAFTDYLYVTVGGTLSNAGVGGTAFRFGPQINNVYEMDVITGRGELFTCSRQQHSDLFYAVLGGLGQFGIITRARIVLEPAPKRVRYCTFEYDNFTAFTQEQEHLISLNNGYESIEGMVSISKRTSAITYHLQAAKYYNQSDEINDEELIELLSYKPKNISIYDFSYYQYIDRFSIFIAPILNPNELKPNLDLMVPASRIVDFDAGVFHGIAKNDIVRIMLVYPVYRDKWDEKMSAPFPEESVFYLVGIVRSTHTEWERLEQQNQEILNFMKKSGIKYKQYLAYFNTREEWKEHFGSKWSSFKKAKNKFDPLKILAPAHKIFNSK